MFNMNKLPEGLKFFMDARKKKLKENNARYIKRNVEQENLNPRLTTDALQNSCFYCAKVFINSSYLLKHILRRHSDEVVSFHKKYSQSDPCDLKNLFTFLEAEFSELKNEILTVKQAMGLEISKLEEEEEPLLKKTSKEAVCYPAKMVESSGVVMTDIHSNKVQTLESKLNNIEDKVQHLCDKLEENDKNINSKFLSKQEFHQYMVHKEEKILQKQEAQFVDMRQALLLELKSMLDKQLHENNIEWNTKMTELKAEIMKLDKALATMGKQLNSPEYLQAVERKLENKIFHFIDNIGQTAMKRKNLKPKTISSQKSKINYSPKPKTDFSPNTNSLLKAKINSSPKVQALEHCSSDSQVSLKYNSFQLNHSQEVPIKSSTITPENLRDLIAKKLSSFGIFSNTSKISNSEYEEKIRLVNTNKDYLKMLYHNFSEVYNCVNISADQRVLSKQMKQKRKLRFSEPLISNKDVSPNSIADKADFLNKTCPEFKEETNYPDFDKPFVAHKPAVAVPKSEGFMFQDNSGSGDGFDKFQEDYRNNVKKMFDNSEGKKFHTSSPVAETNCNNKSRSIFSLNHGFNKSAEIDNEGKNIRCNSPAKSASDISDDETSLNKTYVKYHNKNNDAWDKISEIDYEEESLESLSSLEDDSLADNPIK